LRTLWPESGHLSYENLLRRCRRVVRGPCVVRRCRSRLSKGSSLSTVPTRYSCCRWGPAPLRASLPRITSIAQMVPISIGIPEELSPYVVRTYDPTFESIEKMQGVAGRILPFLTAQPVTSAVTASPKQAKTGVILEHHARGVSLYAVRTYGQKQPSKMPISEAPA